MNARWNLLELASNRTFALPDEGDFLVGRTQHAQLPIQDLGCSRRQFRFTAAQGKLFLEPLSRTVPTLCNGQVIEGRVPVREGMLIEVHDSRFRVHFQPAEEAGAPPQSPPRDVRQTLRGGFLPGVPLPEATLLAPTALTSEAPPAPLQSVPLSATSTVIGRDTDCDVTLPHIQVSRQHARIRNLGSRTVVQDLGSANGTFVDGRRIVMPEVLQPGSRIGIGPFMLTFTGDALVPASRTDNLQLEGHDLLRQVADPTAHGGKKTILDQVSLVIRPHELVCLLGPTGSGKSTLLRALSARETAEGSVLINQQDLYANFESLKRDIAVVPQRDILHERLTLEAALRYTARLRLPRDTSADETQARIDELLRCVGLEEHRATRIQKLSGGQRRRASLASELISNPSLLFLDEVTSGLDEHTDREMMGLFRSIADAGKTLVCVTHTLANIEETCHLIVLLTVGGKLAFFGTPAEALQYFRIERLSDVYEQLEDRDRAEALQYRYRHSAFFRKYIAARRSPPTASRVDPQDGEDTGSRWRSSLGTLLHQLPILLARYGRVFLDDRRALGGLMLQCVIVAIVVFLVFGDALRNSTEVFREASHACHVLFVLSVSCFWFGCNNSAKEIVKERAIYTKELQVNLDPASYYFSKFCLQFAVAAIQSLILLGLVWSSCALPGNLLQQSGVLLLAAASGVATGLFLSSIATSEEMALTLVPLVLIPQIILSDVFIPLEGISRWLGQAMASNYWIYGVLRGTLETRLIEQLNAPLALPLPGSLGVGAICLHTLVLGAAAIATLHFRDRMRVVVVRNPWKRTRDAGATPTPLKKPA